MASSGHDAVRRVDSTEERGNRSGTGARRNPAAGDPALAVDADLGFAAAGRDGGVGLLLALRPKHRLSALDRPTLMRVLLRRCEQDIVCRPPLLDRVPFVIAVVLARRDDWRSFRDPTNRMHQGSPTVQPNSRNRASSTSALTTASRKSRSVFASSTLSRHSKLRKRIQIG